MGYRTCVYKKNGTLENGDAKIIDSDDIPKFQAEGWRDTPDPKAFEGLAEQELDAVVKDILDADDEDLLTSKGLPLDAIIEERLGRKVSATERQESVDRVT